MYIPKDKIIVISGGTVSYIRPHFALMAPAYGSIGNFFESCFDKRKDDWNELAEVYNVKTKLAGGGETLETNEDMGQYIDQLLENHEVKCIIMAAAICDFKAESIIQSDGINEYADYYIGKEYNRLCSDQDISIKLIPNRKIVRKIKAVRPDIFLVSFKTTTSKSYPELVEECKLSQEIHKSDLVFGNDLVARNNLLYYPDGRNTCYAGRYVIAEKVVDEIITHFKNGAGRV